MTLKSFALAAAIFLSATIGAQAATVDLGWASYSVGNVASAPAGNVNFQNLPISTTGDYFTGLTYYGEAGEGVKTLTLNNAGIVRGSDNSFPFTYKRPEGVTKKEKYVAVFGTNFIPYPGTATFSLNDGITNFGFTWGSIENYNHVIVTNNEGRTYTISGSDLINNASLGIVEGVTSKYFSLTDLAGIKSIVLKSCCDAFEIANVSAVPLPAAVLLFGSAIAGMGAMRRRKKVAK